MSLPFTITETMLAAGWPHMTGQRRQEFLDCYAEIFERFEINTVQRAYMVMGQFTAETGGYNERLVPGMRESLNYSASRLLAIFGAGKSSARVTPAEANRIQHNQKAIGMRVYGPSKSPKLAKELGNTTDQAGYDCRGWGPLQTTGENATQKAAGAVGQDLMANPELMNNTDIGLTAAGLEIDQARMKRAMDAGDVRAFSRYVNGGTNGMADRISGTALWKKIFLASGHDMPPDHPADPPGTLSIGAKGPGVEAIQNRLTGMAPPYTVGACDGKFGETTRAAVVAFQLDNSLPGTGKVDPATHEVLFAEDTIGAPLTDDRQNATISDLRDSGSETIGNLDVIKKGAVAVGTGTGIKTVSDVTSAPDTVQTLNPMDAVQSAQDHLSKAHDVLHQSQSFLGEIAPYWHMVEPYWPALAVAVAAAVAWWWSHKAQVARLVDHQLGINLGR